MAIDTREKRQAAAVISFYFMGPNVTPNAAQDVEWRQEAGWGYPGIAPSSEEIVVSTHSRIDQRVVVRVHRRRRGFMNMCFSWGV